MKFFIYIIFIFKLYTQTYSISGYIYDKRNSERLISVNISIPELKMGTASNIDGYYLITGIPKGAYNLLCEYVGYKTIVKNITINNSNNKFNITLEEDIFSADVVEVVADAEKKKIEILYDKPVSKIEITAQDIKRVPQVLETDLLRTLQTLPGITSVSDYSSALYVRGGTPDQNLYMLDGADIYNPEHAFGLFSTFNTDAIKNVEISKGGFAANYGGRLSSVIDVVNLDGNRKKFEGNVSISILAAKTTLQMPLGENSSISGSIRRTYFDQLLNGKIENIPTYYFYDGNLKAFFDLSDNHKLTLSYFGGKDNLDFNLNEKAINPIGFHIDWGNQTASARWTHIFNPQFFGNAWLTYSNFQSNFKLFSDFFTETNKIKDFTLKEQLEYHPSNVYTFKFGFELKHLSGGLEQSFPIGKVDVQKSLSHLIGYSSTIWKGIDNLEVELGFRLDNFATDINYNTFSPRFSSKYKLTENQNLKVAVGKYYQFLHRIPRTFFSDIWTVSDKYQEPSSSNHYILGYQTQFSELYEFELELYHKEFEDVYQFNRFLYGLNPTYYDENGKSVYTTTKGIFNKGNGNSSGFEVLIRRNSGAITGWLGYSYSQTKIRYEEINKFNYYSPRHDRNHSVNLVANIDWNNFIRLLKNQSEIKDETKWIVGLNFVYASGQPITKPNSLYYIDPTPGDGQNEAPGSIYLNPSEINTFRLPAYSRLDLSIAYEETTWLGETTYQLQFFNIGNRKNVWFVNYDFNQNNGKYDQQINTTSMFPLIPSFGIIIKF